MNAPTPTIGTAGHPHVPSQRNQVTIRSAVNAWDHRRKQNTPFITCSDGIERRPEQIRWIVPVGR